MGYVSKSLLTTDLLKAIPTFKWNAVENSFYAVEGANWAITKQASNYLGCALDNTGGALIDDEVSLGSFNIPTSASYTIYMLTQVDNAGGIAHILINDVDVAQIDLYGAAVRNTASSVALGTLTAGIKHIKLNAASKNGSSSDYLIRVQSVVIIPT